MNLPFHTPLPFFVSFVPFAANKSPVPSHPPTSPFPPFKSEILNFKFLLSLALLVLHLPLPAAAEDAPGTATFRDPILGITFEHSPDFDPIQFTPPEFSYDLAASMRSMGIDWHLVGLVEKRFAQNLDPETVRSGQVPAILLDRQPAIPPTDDDPGGLLEACISGHSPQRIGTLDAYELPAYPGPYGEEAFCWVVHLPATRRELPPEEGMTEPLSVSIPEGWLLISAPRFHEPDDDAPSDAPRRPTHYDREIRHILETLTPL